MPKSIRWLVAVLIGLSLFPLSASAVQTDGGSVYTCPTEAQNPPEGAATSPQNIRGTEAVPQGESLVVDEGEITERTYTVFSTEYLLEIGDRAYERPAIILCLRVEFAPTSPQKNLWTGYFRIGSRGPELPGWIDNYGTRLLNGVDQAEADEIARGGEGPDDGLVINFSTDRDQIIPLVMYPGSAASGTTELYITSGQPDEIADGDDLDWAMLLDVEEPPAIEERTSPSPAARATEGSGITSGTVTEFNQPTVITLGFDKWRLTFDPAVEVRSFIGDASIVPTRGQFLVIWFDQLSQGGEPLPLGNFTLQTSSGAGEPFAVRPLAQEGTAALIVTEYTWDPSFMSTDTEYRTGIVFDIAPEDTHFVLQYRGPSQTLGQDYIVDLEFDA